MASKFIHIKNDTNQENEDSTRCPWRCLDVTTGVPLLKLNYINL